MSKTPVLVETSRFNQSRHLGRRTVTLRSVADSIRRRWTVVLGTTLIAFAVATSGALILPAKYDASAKIRITPVAASPYNSDARSVLPVDQTAVNTEIQIIGSRGTARRVVTNLGLQRDPEFAGKGAAGTAIERATTGLLARLKITRDDKSYLVLIGVRSIKAAKAALIANIYASTYVAGTTRSLVTAAIGQSNAVQARLRDLGDEAQAADSRLASYRARSGISQNARGETIADQQIGPLSAQLATADSEAAAARSSLLVAERQNASSGFNGVSAVLSSNVITDLRRQRSEAEKRRVEINSYYGPRYPRSIEVAKQIEALDDQIKQEAQRVIAGLRTQALSAEASANSLRRHLNALQRDVVKDDHASVTAGSLERDAQAKRTAYTRLAQVAQQLSQAERLSEPRATIVEMADIPLKPTTPPIRAFSTAGLLIGFIIGLSAALFLEGVNSSIRKPEEIEKLLDLYYIASVPLVGPYGWPFRRSGDNPAKLLLTNPMTMYAEAYRQVRAFIKMRSHTRPTKIIAFASTLPEEGKTTSALSLARVMAMSGDRVLLIDCDVRRAGVLQLLNGTVAAGLSDVLDGRISLHRAVIPDEVPGLDLLLVQGSVFTPIDLFGGGRMGGILDVARVRYDHVILDTPPLLGVADSRTLVGLADATLLMIKWNSTPIAAVDAALAGIEQGHGEVMGAVLTMVERKSEALDGL